MSSPITLLPAAGPLAPLGPDALRASCPPERLGFVTTDELAPLEGVIGQARAMSATAFGIGMKTPGYNLFVVGPPATGKASTMRQALHGSARAEPTPADWCYVYNFDDPYRPRALTVPAGRGRELRDLVAKVITEVPARLSRVFEGEDFGKKRKGVVEALEQREKDNVRRLSEAAKKRGYTVTNAEGGIQVVYAPQGKVLEGADLERLSDAERERMEAGGKELDAEVSPLVREMRQLGREAEEIKHKLVEEAATAVVRELLAEARERFADQTPVLAWLIAAEKDLVEHADRFASPDGDEEDDEDDEDDDDEGGELPTRRELLDGLMSRYKVNAFVDRHGAEGAPVVVEPNPTYRNVLGRIEHRARLGTLVTDHTLIQAGALHRANGGYLVLDARDLVGDGYAWDALKRALKSSSIRIEEPLEELHMLSAAGLQPEPVPLSVKVVLLGTPDIYHALWELDEDFRQLFKVKVDFDESMPRTPETEHLVARFVGAVCREHSLPHFSAGAVARIIEEGARTVEHQGRLSARFGELVDLMREAAYFAGLRKATVVDTEDVQRAASEKLHRGNLVEEELGRLTEEGTLLITTSGEAVGQVNGLEVLAIADHTFGRPMRVTARVRPGRPGVVDVEREAGLGGPIHSKGVLILSGYLSGHYAGDLPLAMSASIVAEQSYEGIDGDSASCAELCALLSSLSRIPLSQSLAITGSINQRGEAQAVGGVNEKIEGFYDVCQRRGLDGTHGVLLPHPNAHHLMLRDDVVAAVRAGTFRIHTYRSVDEAMALLTGKDPGARAADSTFPEGTINAAVEKRLRDYTRMVSAAQPRWEG